ncbi:MAG TPA: ribosomal protein S18-alanine N-acetyltransferase [Anaerolineales bacterium]|nr:ribosomal protein S18-alanine N-acetyltransferase [Anaerolineales bacterium]
MSLIRQMTFEDLPRVHQIDRESFSTPWPVEAFTIELKNPKARCWVIQEADQIIGYIVFWIIIDECHIATIAIDRSFRGKGYARALIQKTLQSSRSEGATFAFLEVRAGNEEAKSLYNSFGFEIVGTRKKYYKDNNEDALLLTLEIKA